MKKLIFVIALFLAVPAFAQKTTPSFELFGGGTWLHADISPDLERFNLAHVNAYGWNASLTENLNSWFGATMDFSGVYSRPTIKVLANAFGTGLPAKDVTLTNEINASAYTFMYGPSVAFRHSGRVVPFARLLLGALNGRASTTSKGAAAIGADERFSETRFAMASGGGVDVAISDHFAVRGTADWIRSTFPDFSDDRQNSIRISGGVVYRIGRK